jgi:transcriptional regulator with XRE-family HTH domain
MRSYPVLENFGSSTDQRLAERLEALRQQRSLSLDQAALRSGVSRATLSRIERGETSPTAYVLGKLCAAYSLTMSQLLLGVEQDAPRKIEWCESLSWQDPETGFKRTSVSPPQAGYQVELIWAELPAGQRIAYERPPQSGIEQHVLLLSGSLTVECDGDAFDLGERDCLRFHLSGPTAFENMSDQAATYIIALRRLS